MKILTIGNSFSDDAMQYAVAVARNTGVEKMYFGNIYGSNLYYNYENAVNGKKHFEYRVNDGTGWNTTTEYKLEDALKAQNWDYISFQQASGDSGLETTYEKLGYFLKYVRNIVGDAPQFCWHMTWAYQQTCTLWEFSQYNNDQLTMYNAITDCVNKVIINSDDPEISSMLIIPNTTAIQNARTSYIGDNLTRDGYHLTENEGRYLAALTLVHAITGLSIDNISAVPENIEEYLPVLIESANNAVNNPFIITQSKMPTKPTE